ncbi:MAG: class I SAM-dependent methyltransferase [Deltaproteobacteria bacterium]|nr:class I SAM-dependent methyltransferase [Deltaproteobacteria bacterium]
MNKDKLETQKQWNENPCGTGDYLAGIEYGSLKFFDEIQRSRYEVTDTWMKQTIDFNMAKGKKLLEIGHGIGTDLLTFCEGGAEVYAIDITEEHHKLATLNFKLHGKECVLKLCDSANIDFPSDCFDYVYSHGVLHHTPDTVRCISEAYRVLKPGGLFVLSLYHTYSAFHIFSKILYDGLMRGKLKKLGYRGLMSTVEYGADGINIKPLVKTYSKRKLRIILEDFSKVDFKIAHFKREHIPLGSKFLPRFIEKWLEHYLGWYVIAFAVK